MFQLITPTSAMLKSVTPRQEHHGEDIVVALSMRIEITGPNTLLDLLSPKLRHALYQAPEGQEQLPGVEASTPLLRFDAFDHHTLKACFDGWTLKVDHGVDEHDPIALGGAKVDSFRLEAMQGGTCKLTFRVGSNDVSSEEIGLLCGKLGSEISITLHAPEKPAEVIDGSTEAFKKDHPDAGDMFAAEHGADQGQGPEDGGGSDGPGDGAVDDEGGLDISGSDDAWPFPKDGQAGEAPPQSVTTESTTRSPAGSRTARGRERTKKALAEGLTASEGADA